uniref:Uncharacterized protein n=1 Tax=Avena sativa TaxID=4498 RepID=A0ACD5U0K0_AVESA
MAPETQPHLQPPPSWSAIPLDLAVLVLRLLPAYADRARFAAVCPQWRAATRLPLPPPHPLLALPNGTFYSLPYTKPFRFPGCGFAGYDSACGSWLVFSRDDGCFLVDPFSRATVTLPALSRVRLRPPNAVAKWSDVDDGRAKFGKPYTTWMHISGEPHKLHISKLIMCSQNLVAVLVGIGHTSQILMCQPGALSWSVRAYDRCKRFEDMAFYQGKLYAIATDENLLVANISEDHNTGNPQVSKIGKVIQGDPNPMYSAVFDDNTMPCKKIYLVESRGTLLMVRRTIWCQVPQPGGDIMAIQNEFEVFRADFEHSRWDEVTTVGDDQLLFLGRRCSRAVSVSQYDIPGDNILFLDDDEENHVQYAYEDENTSVSEYNLRFRFISSALSRISWKRGDEMRLAVWLFPQN